MYLARWLISNDEVLALSGDCFLLVVLKHPCLKPLCLAAYPTYSASSLLGELRGLVIVEISLFLQVGAKLQWGTVWGNLESFLLFQAVGL